MKCGKFNEFQCKNKESTHSSTNKSIDLPMNSSLSSKMLCIKVCNLLNRKIQSYAWRVCLSCYTLSLLISTDPPITVAINENSFKYSVSKIVSTFTCLHFDYNGIQSNIYKANSCNKIHMQTLNWTSMNSIHWKQKIRYQIEICTVLIRSNIIKNVKYLKIKSTNPIYWHKIVDRCGLFGICSVDSHLIWSKTLSLDWYNFNEFPLKSNTMVNFPVKFEQHMPYGEWKCNKQWQFIRIIIIIMLTATKFKTFSF